MVAVGNLGENYMFLVVWAVVAVENKINWEQFIELLTLDIEI